MAGQLAAVQHACCTPPLRTQQFRFHVVILTPYKRHEFLVQKEYIYIYIKRHKLTPELFSVNKGQGTRNKIEQKGAKFILKGMGETKTDHN